MAGSREFRLTRTEVDTLNQPQIATGSQKQRDPRFPPFAFTEHGAIQAANVLNSPRAAEMGMRVVRAFVRMREILAPVMSSVCSTACFMSFSLCAGFLLGRTSSITPFLMRRVNL